MDFRGRKLSKFIFVHLVIQSKPEALPHWLRHFRPML
jgi:hypothetical protein